MKRLTIALPEDVWNRLQAEAFKNRVSIGTYLSRLVVKRDTKMHKTPDTGGSK